MRYEEEPWTATNNPCSVKEHHHEDSPSLRVVSCAIRTGGRVCLVHQHPFRLFGEVLASAPEGRDIWKLLTNNCSSPTSPMNGKMELSELAKGLPYAGHPWLLQMPQHPGSQQPQWQLAVQALHNAEDRIQEERNDWDVRLQHFVTPLAMSTKLLRPCWHISLRQCAVALSGSATKVPQCAWMPWASCTADQNYMESVRLSDFLDHSLRFLKHTISYFQHFPAI